MVQFLNPGIVAAGWTLISANAINNSEWIVGDADHGRRRSIRAE
jgi:hypothetical protein